MKQNIFGIVLFSLMTFFCSFHADAAMKEFSIGDYKVNVPQDWEMIPDSNGISLVKRINQREVMCVKSDWSSYSRQKFVYEAINHFDKEKNLDHLKSYLQENFDHILDKIKFVKIEKRSFNGKEFVQVKWSGVAKGDLCVEGMKGRPVFFSSFLFSEKAAKFPTTLYRNYFLHCYTTMDSHRVNRQFNEIMKSFAN